MPERLLMARLFLTTGVVLAVLGLVLWCVLRIPVMFPPYLVTAVLAVGYGAYCRWFARPPADGKP